MNIGRPSVTIGPPRVGNVRAGVALGGSGGGAINWLWQAKFSDDEAAPLASPQSADIGTLTITDSNERYLKTDGALFQEAASVATAWIDPQAYSTETFANAVGLAQYTRLWIKRTDLSNGFIGFDNKINQNPANKAGHFVGYNDVQPLVDNVRTDTKMILGNISSLYTDPLHAEMVVVSRSPGAFFLHRFKPGMWRMAWVDDVVSSGSALRWRTNSLGREQWIDEVGIGQLTQDAWLDRYGVATEHKATSTDGDTIVAEADALIYHIIEAITGVIQELIVRRVDDDNCWIVRFDQTNSTLMIIEKVAGVETERASVAHTWVDSTSYRIGVILDKYTIRVFTGGLYRTGWTSARTNSTATGVAVSHAGTELVSWPLYVSLDAGSPRIQKSIFPVGDSKTHGEADDTSPYGNGQNGFPLYLAQSLSVATGQVWDEWPKRIGRSSYGVNYGTTGSLSIKAVIDADLSVRYDAPDFILCNLGVNDINFAGNEAQWVADYQYIIDTLHNKYPNAQIGVARVAKSFGDWTAMNDTYIPQVISGRSWASLGPDERVVLGENWAGLTTDGVHPNHAGHLAMAAAWQAWMGY